MKVWSKNKVKSRVKFNTQVKDKRKTNQRV